MYYYIDMRTTMVNGLFVLMVLLGLASAQINFSTSWGKRAAAASAERMVTSHRASQLSGEVEAISPPTSGDELLLVPIQPKELMEAHQVAIKSLLFIHQVVEVNNY